MSVDLIIICGATASGKSSLAIDLAKKLLECKELSVLDVACLCGFEDIYYFSKTFKKEKGVSPLKFKKSFL